MLLSAFHGIYREKQNDQAFHKAIEDHYSSLSIWLDATGSWFFSRNTKQNAQTMSNSIMKGYWDVHPDRLFPINFIIELDVVSQKDHLIYDIEKQLKEIAHHN